jgi:hypothetical protein
MSKPRTTTNKEVARLWRAGIPAQNHLNSRGARTFTTDGRRLFSYNLCIGYVNSEGDYVIINHCAPRNFCTMTTSQHVSLGGQHADANTDPENARVPPNEPPVSADPACASALDALNGHLN